MFSENLKQLSLSEKPCGDYLYVEDIEPCVRASGVECATSVAGIDKFPPVNYSQLKVRVLGFAAEVTIAPPIPWMSELQNTSTRHSMQGQLCHRTRLLTICFSFDAPFLGRDVHCVMPWPIQGMICTASCTPRHGGHGERNWNCN